MLFRSPVAFASEYKTRDFVEVNQYSGQKETYLIQYEHQKSGQKIVQVFNRKSEYMERLSELNDSYNHHILVESMARNGHDDMFLTRVLIN